MHAGAGMSDAGWRRRREAEQQGAAQTTALNHVAPAERINSKAISGRVRAPGELGTGNRRAHDGAHLDGDQLNLLAGSDVVRGQSFSRFDRGVRNVRGRLLSAQRRLVRTGGRAERAQRQPPDNQERPSERGDAMEQHGELEAESGVPRASACNLGASGDRRKRLRCARCVRFADGTPQKRRRSPLNA